ncbi:MAG TPA: ABC transporter ATP-binding protein [Microbacteriaceae bacterium]|nr:ABC transporter ATP-binding protein [Microbacteriaceae bacterium]
MLEIRTLSKAYDAAGRHGEHIQALDSVDLEVADGEFLTVLGPSGCGKTTLLRAIAGFEAPDAGTIRVAGRLVAGGSRPVPAHERGIGLVPQEGALFPHLSVAQNVAFGLGNLKRKERQARVAETLELVGLAGFGPRRPHELSGGQQQRVALARAIAPGPRIILFDEPFSALDEYLRESLRTEVRGLLADLHATVMLVTHDQEEALALGDRVAVMRDGRVVQVGGPRETYYQPVDLALARFLGEAVVVQGDVARAEGQSPTVSCAFGTLPVAAWHGSCGRCDVLIRPENIRVCRLAESLGGPRLHGTVGTVLDQTFYGHDGVVRVSVPEIAEHVSVRVMGNRPFGVGEKVELAVDSAVCTYPG